jgi:hypothetical protein
MATRTRSSRRFGDAHMTSKQRTVEKFLLDMQHNARLLGHAALVNSWEIAISVAVHIDNAPKRIEAAYTYAHTLPEAEQRHFRKALHRLYRGWQAVQGAVHKHRTNPSSARKELRRGALELYTGAGDAYSLMHHYRYGTSRGYLATRHEFKRSLRQRRKEVGRSLRAWPGRP